jgi:hypothetical protein
MVRRAHEFNAFEQVGSKKLNQRGVDPWEAPFTGANRQRIGNE